MMPVPKSYQVAFDVFYEDNSAMVGYVIFENALSAAPYKTGQLLCDNILPYESGAFYKRELPCILKAINAIEEKISLLYIDANVWLGKDKKGLGKLLHDALNQTIPVIGISKSCYNKDTELIKPVIRPSSTKPLYVSTIGIALDDACDMVSSMVGAYRLPKMIKLADTMSRSTIS